MRVNNQIGSTSGLCTGTLITPQLVLTAQHCIFVDQAPFNCTNIGSLSVDLGGSAAWTDPADKNKSSTVKVYAVRTVDNACTTYAATERDLAVLYLERPVAGLPIVRPSLIAPTTVFPPHEKVDVANLGMAGWSTGCTTGQPLCPADGSAGPFMTRRKRYESVLSIERTTSAGSPGYFQWETNPDGTDIQGGDSGGPLFVRHPDGRREVIGVLWGFTFDRTWADITAGNGKAWLKEHAEDALMGPLGTVMFHYHGPQWYPRHGKSSAGPDAMWYGEVDYTGPCDISIDQDCDHWWDQNKPAAQLHDNCPRVWNPDQNDFNDDGIGDVCGYCPNDAVPDAADPDNDHVCSSVDNCPTVANADQKNCNREAEIANGRAVLGDACDPVPCPGIDRGPGTTVVHTGAGNSITGGFVSGRTFTESILYKPVPPHVARTFDPNNPTSHPATYYNLGERTTGARYCQSNWGDNANSDATLINCHASNVIKDLQFGYFANASVEAPPIDAAHPWHRVTLSWLAGANDNFSHLYDAGHTRLDVWDYAFDYTRWVNAGQIPLPATGAGCYGGLVQAGTCLEGRFWYHGFSGIGSTQAYISVPWGASVGIHGDNGADLENAYTDIAPDEVFATTYTGHGHWQTIFFWQKVMALSPFGPGPKRRVQPVVFDAALGPMRLHDNGLAEPVTSHLSPSMQSILGMSFVYAPVLEGVDAAPSNLPDVEAGLLSSDYSELLDLVLTKDGALVQQAEVAGMSVETGLVGPYSPSPRTDAIAFTSGALRMVFVVGGNDAAQAPLGDVYVHHIGSREWRTLPSTVTLHRIRAAAATGADHSLWLLDDDVVAGVVRLVRIDVFTGEASVIRTFAMPTNHIRHLLTVDREGGLLLTAVAPGVGATGTSQAVRLLYHPATDFLECSTPLSIAGTVQSLPLAGSDEYTFVLGTPAGVTTSVAHYADLPALSDHPLSTLFQ